MAQITKDDVLSEIKKISFFLQHSGMFDNFTPKTRNFLESLPIEWEKVSPEGEAPSNPEGKQYWDLKGKFEDKDLFLKIEKSADRTIYTLVFDNKTYKTSAMPELKSILDNLKTGQTPKPKYLQAIYNKIQQNKNEIKKFIVEHYLKGISEESWEILISKDVKRIYLKMTLVSESPEKIIDELKKNDYYRLDYIGVYIKHMIKKSNANPDDFIVSHKLLRIGNNVGFTVSIK